MATKKKATKAKATKKVDLPPTAPVSYATKYATTKAVTAEEAMEHLARGWVLTQNDDLAIVVSCPVGLNETE